MSAFVLVIVVFGSFGVATTTVDMEDEVSCKAAAKEVRGPVVSSYCVARKAK